MTILQSRPYAGEADYALMRRLLIEAYARTGSPSYCTVGDLDWWRCTAHDPAEITRVHLWFDGGRPAGFIWPGKEQVDLMIHPDYRACEPEMAACAEGVWAARLPAPKHFHLWSWTGDAERDAWLAARDYRRTAEFLSFHDLAACATCAARKTGNRRGDPRGRPGC